MKILKALLFIIGMLVISTLESKTEKRSLTKVIKKKLIQNNLKTFFYLDYIQNLFPLSDNLKKLE